VLLVAEGDSVKNMHLKITTLITIGTAGIACAFSVVKYVVIRWRRHRTACRLFVSKCLSRACCNLNHGRLVKFNCVRNK